MIKYHLKTLLRTIKDFKIIFDKSYKDSDSFKLAPTVEVKTAPTLAKLMLDSPDVDNSIKALYSDGAYGCHHANLVTVPEDLFDDYPDLAIDRVNTNLKEVPEGMFDNYIPITNVFKNITMIDELPKDIFKHTDWSNVFAKSHLVSFEEDPLAYIEI